MSVCLDEFATARMLELLTRLLPYPTAGSSSLVSCPGTTAQSTEHNVEQSLRQLYDPEGALSTLNTVLSTWLGLHFSHVSHSDCTYCVLAAHTAFWLHILRSGCTYCTLAHILHSNYTYYALTACSVWYAPSSPTHFAQIKFDQLFQTARLGYLSSRMLACSCLGETSAVM